MNQQKPTHQSLRDLPSVDRLLESEPLRTLADQHGRDVVRDAVRRALDEQRASITQNKQPIDLVTRIDQLVAERARASLRAVLNATGVVLHTNLGRAPIAHRVAQHAATIASSYSTLELDIESGERGSRQSHVAPLLCALTGAEDAIVVNNCAAAVLLIATALGGGREVVVSRGELVEIGGKFRVPDVLAACGARLVEVGTTNRTRAADYAGALGPATALLLKVHRSNFALVGFVEEASIAELAEVAGRAPTETRPAVVFDIGSGAIDDGRFAGACEPTVRGALGEGADLVCFSGDKLLGGPQAGIIVGRRALVARLAAHPLNRALRPGKLELAALEATIRLHRDGREGELPVVRAIRMSPADSEAASHAIVRQLSPLPDVFAVAVVETEGRVGGGTSPLGVLHGHAVALRASATLVERLETELRRGEPPVVARVHDGALVIDPRTLLAFDARDDVLALTARLVREAAGRAAAG